MSIIEIRKIAPEGRELKKYVQFGIDLYDGNQWFVPPLVTDDTNTLSPAINPAFEFCEAQSFMAFRDGKPVGRITGIINRLVNERSGQKSLRFGFVDFIDDDEVVDALFKAVSDWGRSKGMTSIVGPMGFTDMDHEGMLIEGYEELGTMATIYNYPYYPRHMERMGFEKETDWVEFRITVPDSVPEKHKRIAELVQKRNNLKNQEIHFSKKNQRGIRCGALRTDKRSLRPTLRLFPSDTQADSILHKNVSRHHQPRPCAVVTDADDKLVAIGISIQSFSKALQKSRGRLFPFGWMHLLKALWGKPDNTVDLLLIAVKPEYQNKGINALLFADLIPYYNKYGFTHAESNPELEDNSKVQDQWNYFETRQHRRRRSFRKDL